MIALPLVGAQDPPQPKRRRLVGKQPGVAVPLPQQAAMWRRGPLWRNVRAADFAQADCRRKYRTVYNKFDWGVCYQSSVEIWTTVVVLAGAVEPRQE